MSISFTCPNCHKEIEADDSCGGMEANCPSCDVKLIVPVPSAMSKLKEDERECPFCGEVIKKKAIICRFCKEKLDDSALGNSIQGNEVNTPSPAVPTSNISSSVVEPPKENKDTSDDKTESPEAVSEMPGMEENGICPPSDNSETKEETSTVENDNPNASEKQNEKKDNSGWVGTLGALAVIALALWLAWLFVTGLPRLAFWLIAPIIGIVIHCYAKKINKVVISILCCIILLWGCWAHTRNTNSSVNSSTTSGSNTSQKIAEEAKKQTSTLVFITDLKNGFGRITPQMSILFVDGKENPILDEIIYKFEDAVREYYRLKHSSGSPSKEMGKISEINSLQNRFLNKMTRKNGAIAIEYYGNEKEISKIEVGTVFYIYALATFGKDRVFWLKKHTIQPGENKIFFRNDDTAYY